MCYEDLVLACPVCKENLKKYKELKVYKCCNNHSYDIARQGYVNLIISNMKRTNNPGDSREMVEARIDFLNRNFYKPVYDRINSIIYKYIRDMEEHINILDIGCGEGYYLSKLRAFISSKKNKVSYYGMDISKNAVKCAARDEKQCIFAAANNYHLPVKDNSADCILSVFSPIDINEIIRVLKTKGIFIRVLPRINHLIEIREIIYSKVNLKDKKYIADETLCECVEEEAVTFKMDLNKEEIESLLKMTPHYWKSTEENKKQLKQYDNMSVTVDMQIGVFKKISD